MTDNLARAIVAQARARPGLRLGTVDDQLALSDAVELAAGRARALLGAGLRPGQRVALVAPTSTDYVLTWLACLLAGTPVALVNPTYPADLAARMLEPLAPDLVLDAGQIALARRAPGAPTRRPCPGWPPAGSRSPRYMHTSGTTGLPKFCAQSHDYFARLAAAMAGALDLRPVRPGAGAAAAVPHQPDGLRHHHVPAHRGRRADRAQVLGRRAVARRDRRAGHRADPARPAGGDPQARHHRRRRGRAPGAHDVLRRCRVPGPVRHPGRGVRLRLDRGRRHQPPEAMAGHRRHTARRQPARRARPPRHRLAARRPAASSSCASASTPPCSTATSPPPGSSRRATPSGWFDTGDLGRADGEDYLVFLERAPSRSGSRASSCRSRTWRTIWRPSAGLTDHACGSARAPWSTTRSCCTRWPTRCRSTQLRRRIAGLPAFMRPVAVARVGALPRDAAAGKVQRRLLAEQPVLEWVELS